MVSWVVSSHFQSSGPGRQSLSHSLKPLESAHPKNAPVTPSESALTNSLNLKSFGIRTYEKRRGEGYELLTSSPTQQATEPSSSRRSRLPFRNAFNSKLSTIDRAATVDRAATADSAALAIHPVHGDPA